MTGTSKDPGQPDRSPPFSVEFGFPSFLRIRKTLAELGAQPLIKAVGKSAETVFDATAGTGQDSYMLATYGYSVVACERNDEVVRQLRHGLEKARQDPDTMGLIKGPLEFLYADSIEMLGSGDQSPDVVYLDPMYPPKRKKSALARKEMQYLRSLVGDDEDSMTLFDVALRSAGQRVVVKRPVYAEPLGPAPTMSYEAKLVRFDVYKVS